LQDNASPLFFKGQVYVLNYERGAWSKFPSLTGNAKTVTCISCSAAPIDGLAHSPSSYVLFGLSDGNFVRINESDVLTADSNATYTWHTPFFDFGTTEEKLLSKVDIICKDLNSTSISNTVGTSVDYDDGTTNPTDTRTTTVSSTNYILQELAPPGVGEVISLKFSKTGSASAQNEIAGVNVHLS